MVTLVARFNLRGVVAGSSVAGALIVAYTLRKRLRVFDLAYRLVGAEFLVLLPGADARQPGVLAESLRETIAAARHGGLPVTMSVGVSASSPRSFDSEHVFEAADQALYAAKAAGRDRVCGAGTPDESFGLVEPGESGQPEALLSS